MVSPFEVDGIIYEPPSEQRREDMILFGLEDVCNSYRFWLLELEEGGDPRTAQVRRVFEAIEESVRQHKLIVEST